MALHEQCVGTSDEWYTPPAIFEALDVRFCADVASPGERAVPWVPAAQHITRDSLGVEWAGFIWMNPPFGARNGLAPWLEKFFAHGDGIALVPDRTSAPWWQDYAPRADLALAVRSKIRFLRPDGTSGASPAQGTTLLALGGGGCIGLANAARAGLGSLWRPVRGAAA